FCFGAAGSSTVFAADLVIAAPAADKDQRHQPDPQGESDNDAQSHGDPAGAADLGIADADPQGSDQKAEHENNGASDRRRDPTERRFHRPSRKIIATRWNAALPSPTKPGACPRAALCADPWGLGPPSSAVRERVASAARRVRVLPRPQNFSRRGALARRLSLRNGGAAHFKIAATWRKSSMNRSVSRRVSSSGARSNAEGCRVASAQGASAKGTSLPRSRVTRKAF